LPLDNFIVGSRLRDYGVFFGETEAYLPRLAADPCCVFVIDENVWRLHKNSALKLLEAFPNIILPVSEEVKTLNSVQMLYDRLAGLATKKNMRLVSIGGGITQDITGFAASTLYRGIKWTFVPTTLLAQADSCIGGKTSLNYRGYKNLIGTFYPPSEVFISSRFISTLKDEDYLSGLGEIAKLCIIGGKRRAEDFSNTSGKLAGRDPGSLERFLKAALEIKKDYIEDDEFDSGRRNMLNFGHCFGHAIESAGDFLVPHGVAVAAGILLADIVARQRGLLSVKTEKFIAQLLLPILKFDFGQVRLEEAEMISAMGRDKKRTGAQLALVMVNDDLEMLRVNDLEEGEVCSALAEFKQSYRDRRQAGDHGIRG